MSATPTSNPLTAWQRLRAGNERLFVPVRGHRGGLTADPPVAAVLRCSDSGLASELVFGQSWGSLIDVSTWGHVLDVGALGALEFATDTLGVPLIVVLGHQDCHAMRTAVRAWNEVTMPDGAIRTTVEHAFASIVRRGAQSQSVGLSVEEVTTAHIIDTGLALLERSPTIARRVNAGDCGIVCATTGAADGRLRVLSTVGELGESAEALLECV